MERKKYLKRKEKQRIADMTPRNQTAKRKMENGE